MRLREVRINCLTSRLSSTASFELLPCFQGAIFWRHLPAVFGPKFCRGVFPFHHEYVVLLDLEQRNFYTFAWIALI